MSCLRYLDSAYHVNDHLLPCQSDVWSLGIFSQCGILSSRVYAIANKVNCRTIRMGLRLANIIRSLPGLGECRCPRQLSQQR